MKNNARLIIWLLVLLVSFGPRVAGAESFLSETIAGIKAQIAELEAKLTKLQSIEPQTVEDSVLGRSYQLGESGPEVTALQEFLRNKGFFNQPQNTGYYGEITRAALEAYMQSVANTQTMSATTTPPLPPDMATTTPFGLVAVMPPSEAIDARTPSLSWQEFVFTFNPDPRVRLKKPVPGDFAIEGDSQLKLKVTDVTVVDQVIVKLNESIPVGSWTTITHEPSGATFRFGALPGDVNQDALVSYDDLLLLIDVVNKITKAPDYAADLDRNGLVNRADQIAWLNLVNGINGAQGWRGRTLANPQPAI